METQLGFFAKHWTAGRVKTRLAATIGPEAAALVAKRFIETLAGRLHAVGERQVVGFSPADSHDEFAALVGDDWQLLAQCQGDLGQRMQHYFESAFSRGAQRVVLLGADSPDLPRQLIAQAFEQLKKQQLVLSPTDDGGYCLIGASVVPPPVFTNMPWSSQQLWQTTLEHLAAIGWTQGKQWGILPAWYDVDDASDLERLRKNLAGTADPHLARLATELDQLLPL